MLAQFEAFEVLGPLCILVACLFFTGMGGLIVWLLMRRKK